MLMTVTIALHAAAAVFWVGGMAFAYGFLRPAAAQALNPPERLALWRAVFSRFLPAVWALLAILFASGYVMVLVGMNGFPALGPSLHIHVMHVLAWFMLAVFGHLFSAPWPRFREAVQSDELQQAAAELATIRRLVAVNLTLGIVVVVVGASGRYWASW